MENVHRCGGKLHRQFHLIFIRVKRLGFSCVLNCPLIFIFFFFFLLIKKKKKFWTPIFLS